MENKRKYKRTDKGIKFIFKFLYKKGEKELLCLDIGAGGMSFALKERIKIGTVLELVLILPGEERPFYCFAKVSWQADVRKKYKDNNFYFNTGIRFVRMNAKERKKLIRYVYDSLEEEET